MSHSLINLRFAQRSGFAVLILLTVIFLAACGSSGHTNDNNSSSGGSTATTSGGSGSSSGGESASGKTVTLISCTNTNAWCKVYNETILDGLKKAGIQTELLQDPFEPTLQVQHLQAAIAKHPDLILIVASNDDSIVPSLHQANSAGVPVINLNGRPADPSLLVSSILANQHELGQYAAENIIEGLEAEGRTSGNVMAITGTAATHTVEDRMEAFKEILAEHPQFELVEEQDGEWEPILTAKLASQIFAKYQGSGGIQAAYGMADYQANAIIQAAQQSGVPVGVAKKGLIVTGSNCFKEGIENIEKGLQYGTATQAPGVEGKYVVPFVIKYLSGSTIPAVNENEESRITLSNVTKYAAECSEA
jgi:ABC-type sugar transport system substrate-binding protein